MSAALMCDNCGHVLGPLNRNGDDENGERAGWITIQAADRSWDVCTRSCATALLDDPESPLADLLDAHQETIADIARIIKGDTE